MSKGEKKVRFAWIRKHKKLTIFIVVVLAWILVSTASAMSNPENGAAMVTTTKAFHGELQENISTSGSVEAEEIKVYFAPISGKVARLNVAAGDAVKKGDVLISYDSAVLERDFRQAELEQDKAEAVYNGAIAENGKNQTKLNEANTNLAVLDQQLTDYKAYLKKLEKELTQNQRDTKNALVKENYDLEREVQKLKDEIEALGDTPSEELEKKMKKLAGVQKELSRNGYLMQIADSTDYVVELQDEIARVQEEISKCESYKAEMQGQKNGSEAGVLDGYDKVQYSANKELAGIAYTQAQAAYEMVKDGVCADFDGIVTAVGVVEGASVTEGTQLLTLESSTDVKVTFQASKRDVEKLEIGQSVDVNISGRVYTGKISKIDRMAKLNASNSPMVGAEVHLDAPDDKIILGMDAKLTIFTENANDALLVPVEAINADKDGDFLYIVEDGKVAVRRVVCGISNETYSVIVEGITEADEIIVTSLTGIEEGMYVAVISEQ